MRFALLAAVLGGCIIERIHDPAPVAGPDAAVTHDCATYTGQIFAPLGGSVQSTSFAARYIWNGTDIPDRYTSMADLHGNFFIPNGLEEVQGDGSIVSNYTLPAGGSFVFEIGWECDAGTGGPQVPLATAHFTTAP